MATKRQLFKYGSAGALVAMAIIGASLMVNPVLMHTVSSGLKGQTNFLVMLTDPPNVPWGTTELNVTYSGVQLHVVNGNVSNWVAAQESGRINLLSLVNVSQTIARVSLPTGSTVDGIQFSLHSAEAKINDKVYPITILSNQLVVSLRKTRLNGTQTGALIDLRPSLVEICATNSTGGRISYYVLVPSATAIVKSNTTVNQCQIGAKSKLEDHDRDDMEHEYEHASEKVTITSSSLKVNNNVTALSVTFKNVGTKDATVSGLMVHGDFDVSTPWASSDQDRKDESRRDEHLSSSTMDSSNTVPFKINGNSLIPIFGDEYHVFKGTYSRLELKPGQSIKLTFNGVIQMHPDSHRKTYQLAVTPVKGASYTLSIVGDGSQRLFRGIICH